MVVTVVGVGIVRVRMRQPYVPMPMAMRFASRIARRVSVPVMLVVIVKMFVLLRFMNMLMLVPFADVQPDADEHENACSAEGPIQPTLSEGKGERSTRERRGGEIGSRSCCTEITERSDKKDEANAIAEETDDRHA